MSLKSLVAIALLLLASTVRADDDDWMRGKLFAPDVILKNQAALKLSEAQRQTLRNVVTSLQGKVAELDWDLMEAATAISTEIDKNVVDKPAVLRDVDKVLEAELHKKKIWLAALIDLKNSLTAEQIAYLKHLSAEAVKP
jgi:Spy/CpxP family protein refolding chaperone